MFHFFCISQSLTFAHFFVFPALRAYSTVQRTHTHTHKNQTENLREFEHLRYIPIVLLSPVGIVVSEMPVVSLLTSRFKQPNTPRLNRMYFKYSFIPVTDIILFQSPLLI